MKGLKYLAVLGLLAGCTEPSGNGLADHSDEGARAEIDLSGHYRIASLGGVALDYPLEVSANEDSIWWEPACAGQGLSYRPTGESKVVFVDPHEPGEQQIVCDIGFPPELPEMWAMLVGQRNVELHPDRSLRIRVDGEDWLLEATTDPLPRSLAGSWTVERIDGLSTQEMRTLTFKADGREIWWEPRCARIEMSYTLDGDQFAVTEPAYTPPPPPAEGKKVTVQPEPVCLIGLPRYLHDATNALQKATTVARDSRNNLVFSGPQSQIVLSPKAE